MYGLFINKHNNNIKNMDYLAQHIEIEIIKKHKHIKWQFELLINVIKINNGE